MGLILKRGGETAGRGKEEGKEAEGERKGFAGPESNCFYVPV